MDHLRTVKEVSERTGISVRTLHYYDEIGLLRPTAFSEAGYRLYDDRALETLQQILFFREFEIPLKRIRSMMDQPDFDRNETLKNQWKMLCDMAKLYRTDPAVAKTMDAQYGDGVCDYIGRALEEFYKE